MVSATGHNRTWTNYKSLHLLLSLLTALNTPGAALPPASTRMTSRAEITYQKTPMTSGPETINQKTPMTSGPGTTNQKMNMTSEAGTTKQKITMTSGIGTTNQKARSFTLIKGSANPLSGHSKSANRRVARSAQMLDREEGEKERGAYQMDFAENFYRLLQGPVGKEAEALVAAAFKLLSENDRVNLKALMSGEKDEEDNDNDDSNPSSSSSLLPSDFFLTGKLRSFSPPSAAEDFENKSKRNPKFNPTGWRRKRSTPTGPEISLSMFLRKLGWLYENRSHPHARPVFPRMSESAYDVMPEMTDAREDKRNELSRRLPLRHPPPRKPKRRPLEFNPTGW